MNANPEKTLRQPPPRYIDAYSQLVILLSGFLQQMGWGFLGFGMIFVLVFFPFTEWKFALATGPWEVVQGEITGSEGTDLSINDQQVWKYGYKFSFDGRDFEGVSYDFYSDLPPGRAVAVRVNARNPVVSNIEGMRYGSRPLFLTFVLIFPVVGLFMIVPAVRKQAKSLDLLRHGEFTRGEVRSKDPTGTTISINNRTYPVYKYTFDFTYLGTTYQAICKAHITEPLEDETLETILFYPNNPGFNAVYDGISNSPRMDGMGNFIPVSWKKIWVFLAPSFSILITAIAVLLFFTS